MLNESQCSIKDNSSSDYAATLSLANEVEMNTINIHKIGIGFGKGDNKAVSAVCEAYTACIDQTCLQRVAVVVSGGMSLEDAANAARYARDQVGDDVKLSVNLAYKAESDNCTAYVITFAEENETCKEKDGRDKYNPDEIVDAIISIVCANFGVDFRDLVSKHDALEFRLPRELIMYFCRELTDLDLYEIGSVTEDEYVAAMAAISKITYLIQAKENMLSFITYLEKEIIDKYSKAKQI